MNTASRMESTCRPGCIHVSDAFSCLLPHEEWESTGGVQVRAGSCVRGGGAHRVHKEGGEA